MVTVGRRVLLRSVPVLFALLLAFFSPTAGLVMPPGAVPGPTTAAAILTGPDIAAFPAGPDVAAFTASPDATADVTADSAEGGGRTAAVSPPVATGPAATDRPAETGAVVTASALTSQFTARAAASRAPPATA